MSSMILNNPWRETKTMDEVVGIWDKLTTLGVGGILAGAVFVFYRKDFLKERKQNGQREEVIVELVKQSAEVNTRLIGSVDNLTKELQERRRSRE